MAQDIIIQMFYQSKKYRKKNEKNGTMKAGLLKKEIDKGKAL